MAQVFLAINPPASTNLGVDNQTCVDGTSDIMQHAVQEARTNLKTPGGAPLRGGKKTKLHQTSANKRPWQLVQNGDLWMKVEKTVLSKNPKTVKLTKQKGHATKEMVEYGRVKEEQAEGNHQADTAADLGATEEQDEVNHLGWKYAARLKAYTRIRTRIYESVVKVRKGQKILLERKGEREGPVPNQGAQQEMHPKNSSSTETPQMKQSTWI